MSGDGIREAVKEFVHVVDMADMQELTLRQVNALEAVTRLLNDVAEREAGPEDTAYGRGYIAGQHALTRKLLEAIVREVRNG
jgi:hypothetical protein